MENHSVKSDCVAHEVHTPQDLEKDMEEGGPFWWILCLIEWSLYDGEHADDKQWYSRSRNA